MYMSSIYIFFYLNNLFEEKYGIKTIAFNLKSKYLKLLFRHYCVTCCSTFLRNGHDECGYNCLVYILHTLL